jgi:hypothetical protein
MAKVYMHATVFVTSCFDEVCMCFFMFVTVLMKYACYIILTSIGMKSFHSSSNNILRDYGIYSIGTNGIA